MISTSILLVAILTGLIFRLAVAHAAEQRQARRELEAVTRGEYCQGKVLAVQRPFLLESATRLYFEFAPPGTSRPVQCCHTERRLTNQSAAILPSAGTFVTVRYLPERPQEAVIGQLVSGLE